MREGQEPVPVSTKSGHTQSTHDREPSSGQYVDRKEDTTSDSTGSPSLPLEGKKEGVDAQSVEGGKVVGEKEKEREKERERETDTSSPILSDPSPLPLGEGGSVFKMLATKGKLSFKVFVFFLLSLRLLFVPHLSLSLSLYIYIYLCFSVSVSLYFSPSPYLSLSLFLYPRYTHTPYLLLSLFPSFLFTSISSYQPREEHRSDPP